MNIKQIERWQAIINFMAVRPRRFSQILEHLQDMGFQMQHRTLERDLNSIRTTLNIPIKCPKKYVGLYYLQAPDPADADDVKDKMSIIQRLLQPK